MGGASCEVLDGGRGRAWPGWLIDRNRRNKMEMRLEPESEERVWMKGQTV
jgi:hypothetical protein